MQLVSKVSFFTRRICPLASLERQIFLLVKKSITLLTCYIHNYYSNDNNTKNEIFKFFTQELVNNKLLKLNTAIIKG
jgi:ABC-type uncharacterized transport system permease subunit